MVAPTSAGVEPHVGEAAHPPLDYRGPSPRTPALNDAQSIFDPRLRAATAAILSMVALSAFEGLAVSVALPEVASALGNVSRLPWVITAYLLTSGVATVAAGALLDQFGPRPVFRGAVGLFTLGGVLAGLAPTMDTLIAARVLQGIGAGSINAVGLASVGLVFPRHLVGRAFAANTTVWGVMSVGGPGIAALLVAFASWRWIFLVNLPLGAIALWLGWSSLPDRREGPAIPTKLSAIELIGLTAIVASVLYAVDALDRSSIAAAALAAALVLWMVRRNRGRTDALLLPRHAVDAPLGPLAFGVALLLAGGIGTQSFVPLYVSGAHGGGAALTAWSVLFFVVGWTSGANIASRLHDRVEPVTLAVLGATVLTPPGLFLVAAVAANEGPLALVFAGLAIAGLGIGGSTNSALSVLRQVASDDELGRAAAAHQFVRNLGFASGNAMAGAVLLAVVAQQTGDVEQIRAALAGGAVSPMGNQAREAIGDGYAVAALVGAFLALGAGVPLWFVRRSVMRTGED